MAIDRDSALKNAEKLLRAGKLEAAIVEYVRIVTDHPRDWSSVNALGDLYVRAGQPDRAVGQFIRVADHLRREGAIPRAAAVYKKILRIVPDDPRAVRGLAAITEQKAETTRAARAAAEPERSDDPDAKMKAARDAQDREDPERACELLVEAADLYLARGKRDDALAAIAEASGVDPSNAQLRQRMLQMLIDQGDIAQARYVARVVPEFLMVADAYEQKGNHAIALDIIAEAAAFDPENAGLRERVVREFVAGGEFDRARQLARSTAELLIVAEALGKQNRSAEVLDVIGEAVQREPDNTPLREQFIQACVGVGEMDRAKTLARTSGDWLILAGGFRQQGQPARALDAMREATERDPHNERLHTEFVRAAMEAGELGLARGAARTAAELLAVADALQQRGDAAGARQARTEALRHDPQNADLRAQLIRECVATGDVDQARFLARTPAELLAIAAQLDAQGRSAEALEMRAEAVDRDPSDRALRTSIIQECIRIGDMERARRFLTIETAGDDPELLRVLARLEFDAGRLEEGRAVLERLVIARPERRDDLIILSCELADARRVEPAFACADAFASLAALGGDWEGAAAGLQEFVTRVPHHIPALMKLIDVCVDGSLDGTMYAVQKQLTDAYLAAGQGAEARVIAEDLVLREPWVRANVDRCRRALTMTGAHEPDRAIADLLSADSAISLDDDELAPEKDIIL